MSWGQFTPSFLPCNHSLTDVRFQHNWAPPACHRPFPTFYTFAIEGTGFLPQAGKLLGLTTTPVRRNGRRQLSPRESPHSRRLAATCPSRPHPLLADLPCLLGLLPHKRPQAMTFHPNPLLLGASVSPSPPPTPQGEQELSCQPPPVLPQASPGWDMVTAKEGQEVGCRHVWAGDLQGLCRDASNVGCRQGGRPGPRAPRSRGGSGPELPGLQTPRGTLEARGLLPNPRAPRLDRAPRPAHACLLA